MKYCILIKTNQQVLMNGQPMVVPPLFILDIQDQPRLFETQEEANEVMNELKKDQIFSGAYVEEFHQ